MLEYLKTEANRTRTENGAETWRSTRSDCLDLFATAGALRHAEEEEILRRFILAFGEDPDLAMKILFYARDIRGGLGERNLFRVILRWLADNYPSTVRRNMANIAEYGRYDDLLELIGTACEKDAMEHIRAQLDLDRTAMEEGRGVSLLAKWLPSVNTSNPETVRKAKTVARGLGMKDVEYRKMLSALREQIRILENNLRTGDYSFDYGKQTGRSLFKYRKAFMRNDRERYEEYLNSVERGSGKMHTGTLFPYEIIRSLCQCWSVPTEDELRSMDVTWNAQEDFTCGENAIVVADGSGSMYGGDPIPAAVAQSLAIYYAERNKGAFHNHFITFSQNPQMVEIKGKTIAEKVRYCAQYNEVANTDLQRVFELILATAVKNSVPADEMPSRLYIISDMEFDFCVNGGNLTNFEYAKALFESNGYDLPEVVFWNVQSRNRQQPVTKNEQGVALISGCTPAIFSLLKRDLIDPYAVMMDVLSSERYRDIAA